MSDEKGRREDPRLGERAPLLEEVRDWAEAIVYGLGDTLVDMLRAGRRAARKTADEYWERFDRKTKFRRRQP